MLPPALRDRPQVLPYLVPVWELFWLVHPSRRLGMEQPWYIPLSELLTAVRWQGWQTREEQRWVVMLLQALDAEYLRCWQEKAALERETARLRRG